MKDKLLILIGLLLLATASVTADDYIIQDNNQNPLFVVNQTGEKQFYNGNLFLNGNSIIDNQGPLTLDGGNVEIPNGNLEMNDNEIQNINQLSFRPVGEPNSDNPLIRRANGGNELEILTSGGGGANNEITIIGKRDSQDIARFIEGSDTVEIPNGNLDVYGNEIQNVGALELGWQNLTDYPAGCATDEAVQVVGDTLSCTALNPGGTVETGGGSEGQVAFFIDAENVTGSDNFYWNNSEVELGLGTNNPTATLDVNGQTNLRSTLRMNGNDIQNPNLVDGVDIDNPGNAITIDGSNRYQIASGAIGSNELDSNAVTASGGELDASVAGNQLGLNSGTLDVQDRWVDENGDTMTNQLTFDVAGNDFFKLQDASGGSNGSPYTLRFDAPRNYRIWSDQSGTILRAKHNGNVAIESGDLQLGGNSLTTTGIVGGVDLDNPGNGITLSGNQYQISSEAIDSNEIAENSVTNTELANSDSFTMSGLTVDGDAQVRGNLDVWGNIQNTNVTNLNVDGSILPPSGYDATFDIGSSSRRWRNAYFSGTGQFDSGLTVSSGTVDVPSGEIDNSELANDGITTSTNTGIDSESVNLGGDLTINHADTSSQGNVDNSGGTIIQDLSFDGFGHVTSQNSYNLDNRYYTESESDSNFVDTSGDTMNGALDLNENSMYLDQSDGNPWYLDSNSNNDMVISRSGTSGAEIFYDVNTNTFELGANSGGTDLSIRNGNLNMNSNSITNFFGNNCAAGEVVESVNADGTYNCQSITDTADDTYVNEGGDSMTGALDMAGNNIQNVGTLNASVLQQNGNNIGGLFVDESGDSMSGNLNMQNHHVDNLAFLELNSGSGADIRVDGTDAIRMDGNQNVDIPNGDLGVGTSSGGAPLQVQSSGTGDNPSSNGLYVYNPTDSSGEDSIITSRVGGANAGDPFISLDAQGHAGWSLGMDNSDSNTFKISSSWSDVSTSTYFSINENNGNVEIPNGQLQLSSSKITGVATPTNAQDAANKDYVDTEITNSDPYATTYDPTDGSVTVDPFRELQIDEGAGLRLENPSSGTARISMGSHWKQFYIDQNSTYVSPVGQEPLHWDTSSDLSVTADMTTGDNWNNNKKLTLDVVESQLAGNHLSGSGDTINVDDDFVMNTGDTMTGNLDMNYNSVQDVGMLNVSTSSDQIAEFTDTGISLSQPLSVESSGPLSVANGIDLTGSSSNTIESYSTMYLQTSSGSPSDIVLDPTGNVGIDANTSITGDLDMQEGQIKNIGTGNTKFLSDGDLQFTTSGTEIRDSGDNSAIDFQNNYFRTQTRMDVESGLRMESTLDANGNNINNAADIHSNNDQAEIRLLDGTVSVESGGGGSDVIQWYDDSNGRDILRGTEGGNVDIPNGNLDMNSNQINNVGSLTVGDNGILNSDSYAKLETSGGGSSNWAIYDSANSQHIASFKEGGNVDFPNGNLDLGSPGSTGKSLDVGGGANFDGDVDLNNGGGLDNVNDIEMDGNIYGAGVDMSLQEVGSILGPNNGDTDLNIQTQGGGSHVVSIEDGSSSNTDIARFHEGTQNVEIPNGNLDLGGQLSVGSTECNTGQYIDGDGSCTDVITETTDEYVNENGDTMTGDLDMNSNSVLNVGTNNIDIGDGQGNIAMNGQRIIDGGLTQVSGLGVTDSLSTAETEVSGNSVYVQGDVSVDGDFVGAGADVAENIENETEMKSGTVVKLSGNMSVDKTDEARDTAVAGVVSRDPAMVMAKERDGVPIAMSGTVPVKFSDENGEIKPGDMLTTASKQGHAMKCKDIVKCQGSIIGKAMQNQDSTGEVQMMISRG